MISVNLNGKRRNRRFCCRRSGPAGWLFSMSSPLLPKFRANIFSSSCGCQVPTKTTLGGIVGSGSDGKEIPEPGLRLSVQVPKTDSRGFRLFEFLKPCQLPFTSRPKSGVFSSLTLSFARTGFYKPTDNFQEQWTCTHRNHYLHGYKEATSM
jgi:hypothetical protein